MKTQKYELLQTEVVRYAQENSTALACQKFDVPKSTIYRWVTDAKNGKIVAAPRGMTDFLALLTF